jgi:hypothetical protein
LFEVHIVVVPLANTISARHIPATVAVPDGVVPSKYPANVYVILALALLTTPLWEVLALNAPFGWTATDWIVTGWLALPDGVQDSVVVGTETFNMLLPPGATENWIPQPWPLEPA